MFGEIETLKMEYESQHVSLMQQTTIGVRSKDNDVMTFQNL